MLVSGGLETGAHVGRSGEYRYLMWGQDLTEGTSVCPMGEFGAKK